MNLTDFDFDILSERFDLSDFDCEDSDINEFLRDDALKYQREQMANTYVFHDKNKPIAFFSILNDCPHDKGFQPRIWNRFHRKNGIPNTKRIKQYPAIKIGRLGVCKQLQGTGFAYELMDFIKGFSILEQKSACRLLLLDAYNKPRQLKFYENNGFTFLNDEEQSTQTRLMYFDLIQFSDVVTN